MMLNFLTDIEQAVFGGLGGILDGISVIAGGAGILMGTFASIWLIYKGWMIMAGFAQEPFMEFFRKYLFIVMVAAVVAGSGHGFYRTLTEGIFLQPTNRLAAELSGLPIGKSGYVSVFEGVGKVLDQALEGLTVATASSETAGSSSTEPKGLWGKIKSFFNGIKEKIDISGWFAAIGIVLKLMVITAGAVYMAIVSFMTILTSRIFAFASIAVGPIFLFFLPFPATRQWFFSWLSVTVGYFFTYATVMLVWSFMLKISQDYFFNIEKIEAGADLKVWLTWTAAFKSFLACFFLTKVVARIGDLASSWFSAGNITDGTNALFAAAGWKLGRGMKSSANASLAMAQKADSFVQQRLADRFGKNRGSNIERGGRP